ncbi:hypothetical protein BBX45_07580 [Proteus mirabilis]|uniref:ADP-ribosyltransferase n=1 Tax=Proteus mirabilis TaxID=584 RepID=UPI0008DD236C|nr:ADP-ribosyltransferase [Proteus mirabilis]OHY49268.1 hypothetical protein BBX45_07580 [Proteus mirabilis]
MQNMDFDSLTKRQKEAFEAYKYSKIIITGKSFAYHINELLLHHKTVPVRYKDYLIGLDELFNLHHLESDTILHRACFEDVVKDFLDDKNDINIYPAFMSTSISDNNLSEHFAGSRPNIGLPCYLRIKCKAGARAIWLEDKPSIGGESEILLPRGSCFKLKNIKYITDEKEIKKLAKHRAININTIVMYELELLS